MMPSRLEERILRSQAAIARLSKKAEELQIEKMSLTDPFPRDEHQISGFSTETSFSSLPQGSFDASSLPPTTSSQLESRLAEIQQLSTQTHDNFPLQPRADSNFTFVSDWDTHLPYKKDPVVPPRSPALSSSELGNQTHISTSIFTETYTQRPTSVMDANNSNESIGSTSQHAVGFSRSTAVPGLTEPQFYQGISKPVEVFRGNPEVQEMYKTTTERLKQSYAQEIAAILPRKSGAQVSGKGDQLLGLHVPLEVGLRVLTVDESDADSQGGPGMVSRVDEESSAVFVLWDRSEVECGWYFCSDKRGFPLRLQPAAAARPLEEGSGSRVTGDNSTASLQTRREAWEEQNFFTADNAFHGLSDFLLF